MATTTYGSPYVSGTDLVANWPAASLTVANSIDAAGYFIGRGINAQVASYTAVLTDAGKTITMTSAGANTVTIPANSSVAYVVGSRINILNLGAGACTPTAGAGVTISGTIAALPTNGAASVIKTATNTWSYLNFDSGAATLTAGNVTSTTGSPTITTYGIYTVYTYTGTGTLVLSKAGLCDLLICGSGGGGNVGTNNSQAGGGGGGGGMQTFTNAYLPSGTSTLTIGAGGAAGVIGTFSALSTLSFSTGSASATNFRFGGNSGIPTSTGYTTNAASALPSAGYPSGGGGGGGSGGVGANQGGSGAGGAGGAGISSSIATGSSLGYGGGGGGGRGGGGAAGTGSDGGGNGGASSAGVAGAANRGGGGGGGADQNNGTNYAGAAGGSGVIIIRLVT